MCFLCILRLRKSFSNSFKYLLLKGKHATEEPWQGGPWTNDGAVVRGEECDQGKF